MPKNIQLLKQLRNAAFSVAQTTDSPEHKTLLSAADYLFNELMLQDNSAFYVEYFKQGRRLLTEGHNLLAKLGAQVSPHVVLRTDLNPEHRIEVVDAEITKLYECLVEVVNGLDESRSSDEKRYFVRLCKWENTLYTHRSEQTASPVRHMTSFSPAALETYLEKKVPQWADLEITDFKSLDGGFSKETILFETHDSLNGHQSLVIRAEQPVNLCQYEGSDVRREFPMIELMRKSGLPIAEPLWLESDATHFGHRFIVSRKAKGRTYGGNLGGNQPLSSGLLDSVISTFIKMHNIVLDPTDPLMKESHLEEWIPYKSIREATRYYVTVYLPRLIRLTDIQLSPQMLRGLKWLERNVPESNEAPVIVHIDFAFNNLIIDGDHVSAVLDWETSRLGDPAEDIIWTQFNLSAYISMEEFMARYKEGTGREISEYRLAYNRVAKCALNAITCLSALRALDAYDAAHVKFGILAFKYMALFGSQFDSLIDAAELARCR